VNTVLTVFQTGELHKDFEEECIICDMPGPLPYQKLDLAPTGSPVYQLAYYASHNFSHFSTFCWR